MATVLALPDIHFPFAHRHWRDFLRAVLRKYKPGRVVCLGDEADQYALSDYDHDPDAMSGGAEYDAMMEDMQRLYALIPVCESCRSNHTDRPYRRASKHGIPSAYLKSYSEFMQAPKGWAWREWVEVDGVRYFHGEGYSGPLGALKAAQAHMGPVVIGHLHSYAGVLYNANPMRLFWGMNAGCLIDREKYAFAYGKHLTAKPILGCGIVKDRVPTFIPMELDKAGDWTGDL